VPKIQIYLHEKFHNFLRSSIKFSNLFHPCLEIKLENNFKQGKHSQNVFPRAGPNHRETGPTQARKRPTPLSLPPLTAKWAPAPLRPTDQPLVICAGPACRELLPQIPLCRAPSALVAVNPSAAPDRSPWRHAAAQSLLVQSCGHLMPLVPRCAGAVPSMHLLALWPGKPSTRPPPSCLVRV
jgi:hypothetical protein